jgi:hypothetical protein
MVWFQLDFRSVISGEKPGTKYIALSSRLERYHSRALALAKLHSDRRQTIGSLEQLATLAGMPPANELNSNNCKQARAQFHYAGEVFLRLADKFQTDLAPSHDPADQAIRPKVASLRASMTALLDQGDRVFASYSSGNRRTFEAQILYTDRAHRRVLLAVGDIQYELCQADAENLRQHLLIAHRVRRWNTSLEAFAILLVAAVAPYGRKLYRRMHAGEAALRERQDVLEQVVLERTTELRCEVSGAQAD